ncbi:MAG: hypothetical protein IIW48_13575 [Clostridia bacterium]|nr:hypothetical protein [Clostridia bacterium]
MYCKKCNKYISNPSATYCDSCGTYLGKALSKVTTNTISDDIPRGELLNYLYVVKSLECVKSELQLRISASERLLEGYLSPVNLPEVDKVDPFDKSQLSKSLFKRIRWSSLLWNLCYGGATFLALMAIYLIFFLVLALRSSDEYTFLSTKLFGNTLLYIIIAISVGVAFVGCINTLMLTPPRDRNSDIEKYKKHQAALQEYAKKVTIRTAKTRRLEQEKAEKAKKEKLNLEKNLALLQRVEAQLKSVYSLNIIPIHFRTLAGAVYIYDFMSTSKETLSNAFIHLRFETITEHLKTIDQRLAANEAISRAICNELAILNYQQKQIQTAVFESNLILKGIDQFSDN